METERRVREVVDVANAVQMPILTFMLSLVKSPARDEPMNGKLPGFTSDGLLPADDYELTLTELAGSMLVVGPTDREDYPNWDEAWRGKLVYYLSILVEQLWQVGITDIYVDGSFTEDKEHPNDIDGYFVCELRELASGGLQRKLNLLDPHKIWTWDPRSRRSYRGYPKRQLPMWHRYRVELYPHVGQLSGIRDSRGYELEFPSAFRQSRDGTPRGIIKVIKEVRNDSK